MFRVVAFPSNMTPVLIGTSRTRHGAIILARTTHRRMEQINCSCPAIRIHKYDEESEGAKDE